MPRLHKTNRSLAKRVKVTGNGKILKRKPGQNHFNAKDSGERGLAKHGSKESPKEYFKDFQALMPRKAIIPARRQAASRT